MDRLTSRAASRFFAGDPMLHLAPIALRARHLQGHLHWLLALAPVLAWSPLAGADTLVTTDGRVIEVKKAREEGDQYRLTFEFGEILCPKSHVASVEIEGDMSEYVPKDEQERKNLAQGWVRYRGRWMSKPAYAEELEKENATRAKRTEELARRADFDNAWEQETKHFRMRSNTSPEILQRYADLLETYYGLMDDRIGIKPTPTLARTKMKVHVYKNQGEMLKRSSEELDETVLGYFSSSEQSLNFFHDYKDPTQSEWVALHECTHLLTYLIDPDFLPQIWINEAMADYLGSAEITNEKKGDKKGKLRITSGRLQVDRVLTVQQAIQQGKAASLGDLFLADEESFDGFQYAHAWSFVYFLEASSKYAPPFGQFFKELYGVKLKGCSAETLSAGSDDKTGSRKRYKAEDVRDALLARLKVKDLGLLEKEWLTFVREIPIDGARARFLRGMDTATSGEGDMKQALEDLEAALAQGLEEPRVYWARGYAHAAQDDWDSATADFRRAVEMAPLDATFRADLAWGLSGWWGEGDVLAGTPEELIEAELQFALASALEPENDEFLELYRKYCALRKK